MVNMMMMMNKSVNNQRWTGDKLDGYGLQISTIVGPGVRTKEIIIMSLSLY